MKRLFDISISLIALIALFPLLILIYLLVRINIGSPVFYRQLRPGLNEQIFELVKFRTMTNSTDREGILLSNEYRITKFGKFLRSTSLDELPELWNILKGDMSIVGPRPLLIDYLPLYNNEQRCRHLVRPGLTGWAQINGRNSISWNEKFELDIWYVNNMSILLDLKIIFVTFLKVFRREGINSNEHTTMGKFTGNTGK